MVSVDLRKNLNWLVIAFIVSFIISRSLACWTINIYDDAYITYRYADNLAQGNGFVYNLNERVLGTTTPLFTVILAGLDYVNIDPVSSSRLLSVLFELLLIFALFKYERKNGRYIWLFAALIMLIDPYISRIFVGGMESGVFTALTVISILLFKENRLPEAYLLAGLSYWIRPEGIVTAVLLLVITFFRLRKIHLRPLIILAAVFIVPALMLYIYFGSFIPNSVLVKDSKSGTGFLEVINFFLGLNKDPLQVMLTISTIVFLPLILRKSAFLRYFSLWTLIYLLSYIIARPQIWTWYGLPVFIYKAICTGYGFQWLWDKISDKTAIKKAVLPAIVVLPVLFWTGIAWSQREAPVKKYVISPLAEFCENNIDSASFVYAHDIGFIGYFSGSYIYDYYGLVWTDFSNFNSWQDVLKKLRPEWAMIITGSQYKDFLIDPELSDSYTAIARFSSKGNCNLPPEEEVLNTGWSSDYIMLKLSEADRSIIQH